MPMVVLCAGDYIVGSVSPQKTLRADSAELGSDDKGYRYRQIPPL